MRDTLASLTQRPLQLLALAVLTLALLAGCSSAPAKSVDGQTPPFTLKLRCHTQDHRFTYFEINKKGEMQFGGGREATNFQAHPDFTLSPRQRAEVWRIITEQRVTESENILFADCKTAEYDVDIWPGAGMGRSFRTIDDRSPGVKALHDLLFKYHLDKHMNLPGLPTSEK
jgi:hypothetical protein